MYIQVETTPNPATLKFLPGKPVMGQGGQSFLTKDEASLSPLAEKLMHIDGVTGVFLGDIFISVTKNNQSKWDVLKPLILGAIMDHFLSGAPLFREAAQGGTIISKNPETPDSDIIKEIKELLDTKVRPAVAQDGGDITFSSFNEQEGIVYVTLQGACSGCPSSTATLKSGIENMLRYYIPEVKEVRAEPHTIPSFSPLAGV